MAFNYNVTGAEYRASLNEYGEMLAPEDSSTAIASFVVTIFTGLLILPIIIVSPLIRLIVQVIVRGSVGIAAIPLDAVWQLTSIILVTTSYAWIKYPWSRTFVFPPGLLAATFGTIWATLTTTIYPVVRSYRLAACDTWPATWNVAGKIVEDRKSGLVP